MSHVRLTEFKFLAFISILSPATGFQSSKIFKIGLSFGWNLMSSTYAFYWFQCDWQIKRCSCYWFQRDWQIKSRPLLLTSMWFTDQKPSPGTDFNVIDRSKTVLFYWLQCDWQIKSHPLVLILMWLTDQKTSSCTYFNVIDRSKAIPFFWFQCDWQIKSRPLFTDFNVIDRSKAVPSAQRDCPSSKGRPPHHVAAPQELYRTGGVLPDRVPYGGPLGPPQRPDREDLVYVEDRFLWCYIPVQSDRVQSSGCGEWVQPHNHRQRTWYVGLYIMVLGLFCEATRQILSLQILV